MFPLTASTLGMFILVSLFSFKARAIDSDLMVTHDDVISILSYLHPLWPPYSIPPPSNISGLTNDICLHSTDCVDPRVCFVGHCALSLVHSNYSCRSTADCVEGEFCEWDPPVGITEGICVSSKFSAGEERPVLSEPLEAVPSILGMGLTGDRCFSHNDCRGSRSCRAEKLFGTEVHNTTACEFSIFPCVCVPTDFTTCSTTSDCLNQGELCAYVAFYMGDTFTYITEDNDHAELEPICLSSNLTDREYFFPVSNSNTTQISDSPLATLQAPKFEPKRLPLPQGRISPEITPFSVPELPFFNAFSTHDLTNEFIGGILSLIIVSQIHKIIQSLIYSIPGINQKAYSSYIIFSRFTSFRHIWRLLSLHEPYSRFRTPKYSPTPKGLKLNFIQLLVPTLALVALFITEFATIIAGTENRREYRAAQNFDPVIAAVDGIPRPRLQNSPNEYCDDFFVPTRGVFKAGKVLKCVKPTTHIPTLKLTDMIEVDVFYGSGKTVFGIYSQNGSSAAVELSTAVRSESGVNLKTMPFRPDLMERNEQIAFLNSIFNAIRRRLGFEEEDISSKLWSANRDTSESGRTEAFNFGYRPNWNESLKAITNAVSLGLRDLDLVLNSTGQPWIYTSSYTFERENPVIAVVKPYRIPHGWLAAAALIVTAVHIIVNSCVTHFDDVAYLAMRELIGDDCVLGPLAERGAAAIGFAQS